MLEERLVRLPAFPGDARHDARGVDVPLVPRDVLEHPDNGLLCEEMGFET